MELDSIDRAILAELQNNARISFTELGQKVRLSTPSTIDRIRRLEASDVILGYHARISPGAVGLPMAAIVRITIAGERLARFAKQVRAIPEVLECHRITGTDSYVARVAVRDTEHLETVVDSMMPYVATNTSLILASPVSWRAVTPVQAPSAKRTRQSVSGSQHRKASSRHDFPNT